MTMKEESDINTYLIEGMDIQNQVKAFGKVIIDKMFINIILSGLF